VLNRRLPGINARDIFSSVSLPEIFYSLDRPTSGSRVETFPGAACLAKFAVIHASRPTVRVSRVRPKATPLQMVAQTTSTCLPDSGF
jgi:hypothetical protein